MHPQQNEAFPDYPDEEEGGSGVLILLYMCPHTTIYVSSYDYMFA
jgi:hypothetical protein